MVKDIPDSLLANLNKTALLFLWTSFSIWMFYDATFYIIGFSFIFIDVIQKKTQTFNPLKFLLGHNIIKNKRTRGKSNIASSTIMLLG